MAPNAQGTRHSSWILAQRPGMDVMSICYREARDGGKLSPKHDFWPIPAWLNAVWFWLFERVDLPLCVSVLCAAEKGQPD